MSTSIVIIATFLATLVEAVEALTIILAAGTTRGWRSTFEGTLAAVAVLAALVLALGPALVRYVPLSSLRLIIGALLIVFGLQWLRKAILRASGHKEKHDEDKVFAKEVETLRALPKASSQRDSVAFAVAFKGVFLEGLEVVIIVLTLGSSSNNLVPATFAALMAILLVSSIGALVGRQLSSVPENALKMTVAIMLTSFGTFWSGEGMGVGWPGSDLFILALIGIYGLFSFVVINVATRFKGLEARN